MLSYLPNPIWRKSAIFEKSASFLITAVSRLAGLPHVLVILVCGITFIIVVIFSLKG